MKPDGSLTVGSVSTLPFALNPKPADHAPIPLLGSRCYAANVFFLFYPAPSVQAPSTVTVGGFSFSSGYNVSRNSILSPSDTIEVGDGEGFWSMSAYWPNALMDGSNPLYEGIACRHGGGPGNGINGGRGVVVFADSHAEAAPMKKSIRRPATD